MYSYSLQYLRQLNNGTRPCSNKTSCIRFRKDLDFWFCYGVPVHSLYGLDICKNLLLLVKVLISILKLLLSDTCLTSFEKDYDKVKHVNYNLYQNTNTVTPIETNFYEHNQEHFLFLFQLDDFSAKQGVVFVFQRLVLLEEEESSLCLPLRREEWCFLLNLSSPSCQMLLVRREYQSSV